MRIAKWGALVGVAAVSSLALTGCSNADAEGGSGGGDVTLSFAQWWQPEANGQMEKLVDEFEEANPGIKIELQTGPYGDTKDQLVAGAASGTLPDLIGLDGNWVYDLTKQGVLADLGEVSGGSDLIDSIEGVEVDGGTRMLNVVYATYVLFANTDILDAAGVEVPTTWDEFAEAARAVKASSPDVSPLALPLSLESPVGIKNDVLSWYWASEGSFRDGEGADLEDDDLAELLDYFAGLNKEGLIAPGLANMLEQDKVESFASGQTAMIVSATPHVNVIGERDQVNFTVGAIPTKDDFSGTPGATYASWGIGIADSSDHKEEAWKFVEFLLGAEQNGALATAANMFPANGDASPDESAMAENSVKAFEIWKQGAPVDEFLGLPAAEQLQRTLIEQVQQILAGDEDAAAGLSSAQVEWDDIIGG
ncbi:sugar ABC transporter substrate-binding protein [Microbacterium sp. Re1]|uniref:Sugar ABC transporter substrate-binding protein n=1 Tax=Microbacterium commune TaxID=2762219 RepID=A0ABR8W545_9MICO|nr:sugar ABC transporter substrate-binding protein [Microbacterium commune]MBD8012139.1 sugar ABC transporter substrate-binding protein [Microbacterium commune]